MRIPAKPFGGVSLVHRLDIFLTPSFARIQYFHPPWRRPWRYGELPITIQGLGVSLGTAGCAPATSALNSYHVNGSLSAHHNEILQGH